MNIILFIFGIAIGSFLNVLTIRYNPDNFLFDTNVLGGRSHCPHCQKKLGVFELVPILSFVFQMGRCRHCGKKISFQYPIVELIAGLIFVFIPLYFGIDGNNAIQYDALSLLWTIVFLSLLVISIVDIRWQIIPDEMNIVLGICGIFITWTLFSFNNLPFKSFLGPNTLIFGEPQNIWINRLFGLLFGFLFFGSLIFITRGKGMGMGDLKLSAALGVVFGWPEILFITIFAFMTGAIAGIYALFWGRKTLKSHLPFGPFIVLGAVLVFFWGQVILNSYFSLLGI